VAGAACLLASLTANAQPCSDSEPAAGCDRPSGAGWEWTPPATGSGRFAALAAQLEPVVRQSDGTWGVAIADLNTDETLLHLPDDPFVAASLYKLGVMAEAYRQLAAGRLDPNATITLSATDVDDQYGGSAYYAGTSLSLDDALDSMITRSDNGVALALVGRLGLNAVNDEFRALGMPNTRLEDDAWTTPRDQLTFFRALARGEVVSATASRSMLELLARQQINDRIPKGLPSDAPWRVAHKTGNWESALGDSGIIDTPHGAFALSILADDVVSAQDADATFARIAALTYAAFEAGPARPAPHAPAGRSLCLAAWSDAGCPATPSDS
jgi:beta-lactamase class A